MVRHGGILSPDIFALYMNGLTDELSNSYAGCYITDKCINHIMYADDICLMAPTGTAMQNLLMPATIMELQMIFYLFH